MKGKAPVVELIATGDEVLCGDVLDTNGATLSKTLQKIGHYVERTQCVGDDFAQLEKIISEVSRRADIAVCSGGLGPTLDDLTTDVVCKVAKKSFAVDQEAVDRMRKRAEGIGLQFSEKNLRSARIPEGAEIYQTHVGTAPAYRIKIGRCHFFFLPGPPKEYQYFLDHAVLPWMKSNFPEAGGVTVQLKTLGWAEALLADKLSSVEASNPGVKFGYRVHAPEVWVKLTAHGKTQEHALDLIGPVKQKVLNLVGESVFGEGEQELSGLVHHLLIDKGLTLSLAESCTGGLIASSLTHLPGSSKYLIGGVVAYSNQVKRSMLNVSDETLQKFGAVSTECVREMAIGAIQKFNSDYSISVSGIAGPSGGTEKKPVGLVYLCLASKEKGICSVIEKKLRGDRERVQRASVLYGLEMLRREILGLTPLQDGSG